VGERKRGVFQVGGSLELLWRMECLWSRRQLCSTTRLISLQSRYSPATVSGRIPWIESS